MKDYYAVGVEGVGSRKRERIQRSRSSRQFINGFLPPPNQNKLIKKNLNLNMNEFSRILNKFVFLNN